jgi:hypothetical protein
VRSNNKYLINMRKLGLLAISFILIFMIVPIAVAVSDVSVGVKQGDWIQYNVIVTGNPPGDHNIKWASMNVTAVQGTAITLEIQTLFNNGTNYPEHITLNLATGILGDDFFIPKNLNVGDKFYDAYQGNITITNVQQRIVAGAERTVVLGATNYTRYAWDRTTGTLVAATSNETEPPQYYMVTNTNATNIWQPDIQQTDILGFAPATFYDVLAATVIAAVAVAVVSAIWIWQRKTKPLLLALEAVGGVFVAIFLAAYLGGMPTTNVLHSLPVFKAPLIVLGVLLLVLILANTIMAIRQKEFKSYSALKIGLLIVAASYFLFNLHSLFTLGWVGEWNRFGGGFSLPVFIQDITNFVGIITRFIGGIIAIAAVLFYYKKGFPSQKKTYSILRWILVLEAIYWISLIPLAGIDVYFAFSRYANLSMMRFLSNLAETTIPGVVESIVPPVALLILAKKLNPNKPQNQAIKWALISGITYVLVFWLTNTGAWMQAIDLKHIQYLTAYPQHALSLVLTAFGLLALAIYAVYVTKKNSGAQTLQELNVRGVGVIITALGMYFLWNYLSWVFFNGAWSSWYAWFLGHNLDLWMLSLPLVGIALLFYKITTKHSAEPANEKVE